MEIPPLVERPRGFLFQLRCDLEKNICHPSFISLKTTMLTLIQHFANCVATHWWVMKWNWWVTTRILKNEVEENRKYQITSHVLHCFMKYFLCDCVCIMNLCICSAKCFSYSDCRHWPGWPLMAWGTSNGLNPLAYLILLGGGVLLII